MKKYKVNGIFVNANSVKDAINVFKNNILDGTHLIKGIVFKSIKKLTNNKFNDLYDSGIAYLDDNVFVVWWYGNTSHQTKINEYKVDEVMTFATDEVNGEVIVDFSGSKKFSKYQQYIRIKANQFFKGYN